MFVCWPEIFIYWADILVSWPVTSPRQFVRLLPSPRRPDIYLSSLLLCSTHICFIATLLYCYSATLLYRYITTLLYFYLATVLLFSAALLLEFSTVQALAPHLRLLTDILDRMLLLYCTASYCAALHRTILYCTVQ